MRKKPRTYYQQIAAAIKFEGKLDAKLVKVTREHGKANFTFKHNKTGKLWRTTLSKLENYNHNKYHRQGKSSKGNKYSYTSWKEAGESSTNFVGYQCYIIECKSKKTKEHFYKIGKTFIQVHQRCKTLPYEYRVLKVFTGQAYYISDLEHKLQKLNRDFKYYPSISFSGETECFSNLKEETFADFK